MKPKRTQKRPFALSLSKGGGNQIKDFDKLSPNGLGLCIWCLMCVFAAAREIQ